MVQFCNKQNSKDAKKLTRRRNALQKSIFSKYSMVSLLWIALLIVGLTRSRKSPQRKAIKLCTKTECKKSFLASCLRADLRTLDAFDSGYHAFRRAKRNVLTRSQETTWELIVDNTLHAVVGTRPLRNVSTLDTLIRSDIRVLKLLIIHSIQRQSAYAGKSLMYVDSSVALKHVYRKFDRDEGLQYLATYNDISAPALRTSMQQHTLIVRQRIGSDECEVGAAQRKDRSDKLYILIALEGRIELLRSFIKNFLFLRHKGYLNISLLISVLRKSRDIARLRDFIQNDADFQDPTHRNYVRIVESYGDRNGQFSRAVLLRDAARAVPESGSLLFFCDVDMHLSTAFLARCRANTVRARQVYYPVVYSLYSHGNRDQTMNQVNGFWRTRGFGMLCIYRGDFLGVGAFDDAETRFDGWGREDVYQYDVISSSRNLRTFRATEPGLIHRWHPKRCDPGTADYKNCIISDISTMGHPSVVGKYIFENGKYPTNGFM